MLILNMVLIT